MSKKRIISVSFLALFLVIATNNIRSSYSFAQQESVVASSVAVELGKSTDSMPVETQNTVPPKIRIRDNNETALAFIRIPKTGSSSMMSFLLEFSGLLPLDHAVPSLGQNEYRFLSGCVFGKYSKSPNVTKTDCAHIEYERYQKMWGSIRQEKLPSPSAAMETITMVREPFDFLRSFYNMHREYRNNAGHTNTDEQLKMIDADNFAKWLELTHTQEDKRKTMFQFEFLDKNVDKAIAMISGSSPNVTVLLNECYEESLRLLDMRYAIRDGAVDEFRASEWFHSRKAKTDSANYRKEENRLREKAKRWFADEYKFYNAAAEQFRRQLSFSGVNPSTNQSFLCGRTPPVDTR